MRCWAFLDEATRRVLLAMPLFHGSASEDALAASADVQNPMLRAAIDRLRNLALIDALHTGLAQPVRYSMHPLVHAFASEKLRADRDFERNARERWVHWYINHSGTVGYCWNDPDRLNLLDPEQATVHSVIQWCRHHQRHADVIALAKGAGYYYLVRGLWEREPPCNLAHAEAARQLGNAVEEMQGLAYHIHMLCRQGRSAAAEPHISRLLELATSTPPMGNLLFDVQHALALYATDRGNLDEAQAAWEESLEHTHAFTPNIIVVNQQWLAHCLMAQGKSAEAKVLFDRTLTQSLALNMVRRQLFCTVRLARIALEHGDIDRSTALVTQAQALAHETQDHEHIAETERVAATIAIQLGHVASARASLAEAADHFERMGLRRDFQSVQDALAVLNASSVNT